MDTLITIVLVSIFLGAFVAFPLFAAWDLKRQGHKVAPKLLVLFAVFVVFSLVVDLVVITALGTNTQATFHKVGPPTNTPHGKAVKGTHVDE